MHTFTTVIDVIERSLGTKLSAKVLKRKRGLDFNVRKRIAIEFDKYEHEEKAFTVPQKDPTEIFPYVHPRWLIANDLGGAGYKVAIETEILNIKSLLLYYHRIALPDGFEYLCDIYRLDVTSTQEMDKKFDAYLNLFAELRQLIQNGTVFFMPEIPTYYPAREATEKLKIPDWFDKVFEEEPLSLLLRRQLEESLWINKEFNLDLLLPNPRVSDFFVKYMLHTSQSIPETKLLEAKIGSILLECQLPRLENLSVSDIAAIRNNNEGFAAWRASLRSILETFYKDYSHAKFDQVEFERYANEELSSGKRLIEEEISRSHCLNLLKAGTKTVGVGIATALLVTPFAPAAAIAASVATAGTTFLIDYFTAKLNKGEKGQLDSLKTHYAIFSPDVSK